MKIKRVIGYGLSSPFQNSSYLGCLDNSGLKNIGIIEIHTECGVVGFGETYAGVYCAELMESVVRYLEKYLIGLDVDTRLIHNKIFSIPYVGRNGLLSSIGSGINIALYDIIGKKENKPVYKILNDSPNHDVMVYASNGSSTYSVEEISDDVESVLDLGFDSYKMRIGYQDLPIDLRRVEKAREKLGDKVLMIDSIMGTLNPPWTLGICEEVNSYLEDYNPYWWEEPLHPTSVQDMGYLTHNTKMKIAGGEALNSKMEFESYEFHEAVNVIQPDVTNSGGFDECDDICRMNFEEVALHVWGSGCAFLSNLHFALSNSKVKYLEVPMMKLDITDDIMETKIEIKDGRVEQPDVIGIGINITEDIKEKYKLVTDSNYRI